LDERRPDLALAAIDSALAMPQTDTGWTAGLQDLRGRALNNLGRLDEAVMAFQLAIESDPGLAAAHHHLGHVLLRLTHHQSAEAALRAALDLDPTLAAAWSALGSVLTDTLRWTDAEDCFRRARELEPRRIGPHLNHGLALEREGRLDEAAAAYEDAAGLAPDDPDPEVLTRMGLLALSRGEAGRSRELLAQALSLDPRRTDAAAGIAAGYDIAGEYQAGWSWVEQLDAASRRTPDLVLAAAQLSLHCGLGERALPELAALCQDEAASSAQRSLAWFSRGEILEQLGAVDDAWDAFVAGNQLQPRRFDPAAHAAYIDALLRRSRFSHPVAEPTSLPVLILGLPRSGSSLLEQMLAMHPDLSAGGERVTLGRLAADARTADDDGDDATLVRLRRRVLSDLHGVGGDAPRITDKMWQNFEYLDVVQGLLPGATVVHIKRHPLDVALSCFTQSFGFGGVPFSYDSEHIAQYLSGYRRIMAHWQEVLDLDLVALSYDELVTHTEDTLRRLLSRIGLGWDPACLAPHTSQRVVTTASNAQVREPVHDRRLGRWERYRDRLPERWLALAEVQSD
jgi:tetratricopeptide (TPR) repeat protein